MREGARKFDFPQTLLSGEYDAVMLCIPTPLVPYFRRFFSQVQCSYIWKTQADYERAYPVFAEIEAQMVASSCVSEVTESINRLYRLLDTTLNGTAYTSDLVAGATVVSPAIPAAPPTLNPTTLSTYALRQRLERIIATLDGGAEPSPEDNLLVALRGTVEANEDRNVIDATKSTELQTMLDEVEQLLRDIKAALQ